MSFTLYNVPIDHLSEGQLELVLRSWVQGGKQRMIVTPNPEMILRAREDELFLKTLQSADLSLADGVGLRFAVAALHEQSLRFRHTGVDTVRRLAHICEDEGKTMVLLGGKRGIPRGSARSLRKAFKDLNVVGVDPGVLKDREGCLSFDPHILAEIRRLKPTVLAVAFGAGKQEKFIAQYLPLMPSVKVAIGIGGALDMLSGYVVRAPKPLRSSGLEWVWRLLQEPRRFGRIWQAAVVFPGVVAYDSLNQRRFLRAVRCTAPEIARQLIGR